MMTCNDFTVFEVSWKIKTRGLSRAIRCSDVSLLSAGNFYSRYMGQIGKRALDMFEKAEPLQKAWVRENGAGFPDDTREFDIRVAQLNKFTSDVVYVQDLF